MFCSSITWSWGGLQMVYISAQFPHRHQHGCTTQNTVLERSVCRVCRCMYLTSSEPTTHWKKYTAVEKSAMHVQTPPPPAPSMLYNRTVDGWHHYRPCLCKSKNMVQDSNSMWHLCNWGEREKDLDHKLFLWQSRTNVTERAGEEGTIQTRVKSECEGVVCVGRLRRWKNETAGALIEV